MSLKVIGAGFGRTGTLSMKLALEELGISKCYHMIEVRENQNHAKMWMEAKATRKTDWLLLFKGYQASVDWPSCNFWREQAYQFPDSKILLTRRDPEKWYESIMKTIYPSSKKYAESENPDEKAFGHWAMEMIWRPVFEDRMEDRSFVIGKFEKHNQAVIDEVPKDRLLVFEASQGWEPLCEFLELPVPGIPFPRVNTTEQFLSSSKLSARKTAEKGI